MATIEIKSKNQGTEWAETVENLKQGDIVIVANPATKALLERTIARMRPDLQVIIMYKHEVTTG